MYLRAQSCLLGCPDQSLIGILNRDIVSVKIVSWSGGCAQVVLSPKFFCCIVVGVKGLVSLKMTECNQFCAVIVVIFLVIYRFLESRRQLHFIDFRTETSSCFTVEIK